MPVCLPDDQLPPRARRKTVRGRPDFHDRAFGKTQAKTFPPYVYSTNANGALVHRVARVELDWYAIGGRGDHLVRLDAPVAFAHTVCGVSKYIPHAYASTRRRLRATLCAVPAPDAVLCGVCHGDVPSFSAHGAATRQGINRKAAHQRLGCVALAQA